MLNNPTGIHPMLPTGINGVQQQPRSNDVVSGFGEVLGRAVEAVNEKQSVAADLAEGLASGQHANIHETMIAAEKSGISFKLMTKMQQKGLDAYQTVMRIQL
ncbi:MAG: flagellar hook-basal body complex protein FliE [Desulfurivibrio sp.]|nr:flagellar hook-basal body complex protein FliE [Desulfurivibrio sp.]